MTDRYKADEEWVYRTIHAISNKTEREVYGQVTTQGWTIRADRDRALQIAKSLFSLCGELTRSGQRLEEKLQRLERRLKEQGG